MKVLSVVIPALNEAENIPAVLAAVPVGKLAEAGWETEILIVDNGSTDGTGDIARGLGARVVEQPERGYGNAYMAGFDAASGDVVATGDADQTYPFESLPEFLTLLEGQKIDFMTTDRLHHANRLSMKNSHFVGNHVLSLVSRLLFRHDFRDSQSGMWIFRRAIWKELDVRSPGMAFSQEIKNAAALAGFQVHEQPIEYRMRVGEVKLNAVKDGFDNLASLFEHRFRARKSGAAASSRVEVAESEIQAGGEQCDLVTTTPV